MFGINFISVFVRNVFGVVVAAPKARRARRAPADRIEWLETRQVLSASTVATVAQLNVITTDLPFDVVEASQNDVVFSESRLLQMGRVRGGITSVSFDVAYGTNPEDVINPELYADLRDARGRLGRSDGIAETRIGAGVIQGDTVVFNTTAFAKKIGRGVVLQFRGDISADAQHGDLVGFEEAEAHTRDGIIPSINYLGGENPLFVVEGQQITLSVAMGSTVGATATPGQISVELGTLDLNATAPTHISQMFVAVTRTDSTGAGYEFAESVPFLYLLNTQAGGGQQLELVGLQNEVAVYRAVDLMIDGYTKFSVLSDFSDDVNDGDQFTLHAIYETGYGPLSIGTLTDTVDYRLQAYGLNGEQVGEVHAGVYSGQPVTIVAADPLEVHVTVKAIGTADTVVSNEKNVNLFRYETLVSPGDAILMTEAVFTAEAGSLLNAQNYALWVDTNSDLVVDTILQKGVSAINGKVVFDDIAGGGYIYSDWSVISEVHADMSSNQVADNRIQLKFAPENIGAEELQTGTDVPMWDIHVFETPSKLITIERNGSLFATQSSTPVRPQYLLAGTKELGQRLTFRAETEDGEVTGITFALPTAASVDRIELYRVGETTPFATATTAGAAGETLPGYRLLKANMQLRQFVVAEGTEQEVLAYVRLKSDENGAVAGEQITMHLYKVQARGASSSSDYRVNNGDTVNEGEVFLGTSTPGPNGAAVGPTQIVTFAEVSSVISANPDADGTNVPTGVRPIGQFRFTAATNSNTLNGLNKVMLKSVSFLVTANNMQLLANHFNIFNMNDSSWKMSYDTVAMGSNTYRLTFNFPDASIVDRLIGSGESDTFAFEVNVMNSKVNPALQSSLQVTLDTDSIVWSDPDVSSTTTFIGLKLADSQVKSTFYQS